MTCPVTFLISGLSMLSFLPTALEIHGTAAESWV